MHQFAAASSPDFGSLLDWLLAAPMTLMERAYRQGIIDGLQAGVLAGFILGLIVASLIHQRK